MNTPVFCAAADDDTGATDLAGMLTGEGLRTVLVLDGRPEAWGEGYDAVILGTGCRALPPAEAYGWTREAVGRLRSLSPRVIEVKYCSTFDSTAEGNIGQSIDAAMDELGETFTVALPALPVNGRTTYMGYHFVHGQLLSESPMRDHPLTPMRNSNLVSHLQGQTRRRVASVRHPVTRDALTACREAGGEIAILDCVSDADLESVCEAIAHLPLISGSSAPAMKLPRIWRREGWWQPQSETTRQTDGPRGSCLIVAGSCSEATRRQNEWFESRGGYTLVLDPVELIEGWNAPAVPEGRDCLLRTGSSKADIGRVAAYAGGKGLDAASAGLAIANALARTVRKIVERRPPARLIVAGGETSTAICRELGFGAMEVGRNIEPGVPICYPLGRHRFPVVLKSGNFGSADFYERAITAAR